MEGVIIMRRLVTLIGGLALAALSCYSINTFNAAPTADPNIVSTIVVGTAQAAATQTAAAQPPTPTAMASCIDGAALVEDGAGGTAINVPVGSRFTVTWQINNTGDCNWHGYSLAFVSGDRLGAPDSIALQDTRLKSTATATLELVAPAASGAFTGLFELRDAAGKAVALGAGPGLSVNVTVADLSSATPLAGSEVAVISGTPAPLPVPPAGCKYVKSGTYPNEVVGLINKARTNAGLPVLKVNDKLVKSAQAHSTDMACNGYFAHSGLNNSTIHDRVVAAGYTPKFSEEMIFCTGYPTDAFTWWWGDKDHHDVIVDTRVTELGVGYAYLPHTQCESYYTVDFGAPAAP